jgi:hypothetical protein
LGPDHPDAIAALQDIGARLMMNQFDRVFRIIFYEQHKDDALDQIRNLPSLKEVWIMHTKIKEDAAKALEERLEGVKVSHG